MEFAIAKLSSKGQLVIPSNMRKELGVGDEFLIVKSKEGYVLKKMSAIAANIADDIRFAKEIELGWQDVDTGKITKTTKEEFLKKFRRW